MPGGLRFIDLLKKLQLGLMSLKEPFKLGELVKDEIQHDVTANALLSGCTTESDIPSTRALLNNCASSFETFFLHGIAH